MSIYTHDPNRPTASSSSSPFLSGPPAPHSSTDPSQGGNGHSSGSQGPGGAGTGEEEEDGEGGKKKKAGKRRKVNHACLYCRRSHMTCDEGRPCQRCIKREIGHLCHDERRPSKSDKQPSAGPSMSQPPSQQQQQPQLVMPRRSQGVSGASHPFISPWAFTIYVVTAVMLLQRRQYNPGRRADDRKADPMVILKEKPVKGVHKTSSDHNCSCSPVVPKAKDLL